MEQRTRVALALSVLSAATMLLAALPAMAQTGGSGMPTTVDPSKAVPISSFGGGVSSLSPNCASGNGCVYTAIEFGGEKVPFGPGSAGTLIDLGSYNRSAANKFNARAMAFYRGNGALLSCINAGNNDQNLYEATVYLIIGGSGTNC